jgi:NAD(P)-dependent dehydrogenase (short-subunit alcohol dehydrogenase family)
VVVTGASSGIGEACALHLAASGYRVYAGVRTEDAAARLLAAGHSSLSTVRIDVRDVTTIEAAAALIRDETGSGGLAGLVNNAGIAVAAPLEFLPLELLREQLEVNLVGQIAVTQAFIPSLRVGRGRIVNMGSVSGRVALPFVSPYAMSKFALEAMTDSLRLELRPWGIHVAIVEPGVIETPIWRRSLAAAESMLETLPQSAHELYGPAIAAVRHSVLKLRGAPVATVVRAVVHALTAARPRARYVVGLDARVRLALDTLPWRIRDRIIHNALR